MEAVNLEVRLDKDYRGISSNIEEVGAGSLTEFEGEFRIYFGKFEFLSSRHPLILVTEYFDFVYRILSKNHEMQVLTCHYEDFIYCSKIEDEIYFSDIFLDICDVEEVRGASSIKTSYLISRSLCFAHELISLHIPPEVSRWIVFQKWQYQGGLQ
jgi:hypothetical protein